MQIFEVVDAADQEFSAVMEDRRVTLRLRYLPAIERWVMHFSKDDEPVIDGRILVLGRDLMKPYDLGLGAVFVWPESDTALPDYDGLVGGTVSFIHADVADLASAA